MSSLPTPSAEALAHSEKLVALIRAEIAAAGGWIGFDRYMELALYAPGLGYYAAGARKFGETGDFVTAPEISPLFAQALAAQLAQIFEHVPPRIVEFGAGTGALARVAAARFLGRDPGQRGARRDAGAPVRSRCRRRARARRDAG